VLRCMPQLGLKSVILTLVSSNKPFK